MGAQKEGLPEGISRRCPKCHKLTCRFDTETLSVVCDSCGFKETLES